MKRSIITVLFLCLALTTACSNNPEADTPLSVSTSATPDPALVKENQELKEKVEALTKELEEVKNEPGNLLKLAQDNAKEYPNTAKDKIKTLLEKYPASAEAVTAKELLAEIEKKEKEEAAIKVAEEAQAKAEEARKLKAALSNTRKQRDSVREIDWYYAKTSTEYADVNEAYIYIGKQEGSDPWIRFRIQYEGDDWLFINNYIFKVDGKTYTVTPGLTDVQRDNDVNVWEWYDYGVTDSDIDMLRAIASSKKTVLRYEGDQYYKDRTITSAEKKAIQTALDAYTALGDK
ncbi:DivIVA domain-containing protein [Paenibacillus caui]|uniref:DivIVA domain-containing protein n=1 Tax=Paenibacillus caui TaxID=2873927 RepID=UPI001CA99DC3|nr:DivIVA domain-containing protein [Paenibacillus caui]